MIVYMILDQSKGRWWRARRSCGNPGWVEKQEQGSVWTQESHATLALKQINKKSPSSRPVKLRFSLYAVTEDELNPNFAAIGGEVWYYDPEYDTWFWGTQNDGCGVYHEGHLWHANVTVCSDLTMMGPFQYRDLAMIKSLELFREKKHE